MTGRRPRVLIVHNRYLQAGGEDIAVEAEAQLLTANGHEVCRLETSNEEMADATPLRAAVRTIWNRTSRARLANLQARFTPDVVHFHNTFPLLSPAVYYSMPRRVAVVQTLHNYRLVCPAATLLRNGRPCEDCVGHVALPAVLHACYRQSRGATLATATMVQAHRAVGTWSRRVDAYIALTPFAREIFIRGGLPARKIHVKPNFVAPDPGVGGVRRDHFLFVGRFEEGKGLRVLMDAWRRLERPHSLRLVGSGPLEGELRALAEASEHVQVLGRLTHEQVITELKQARALIAPMLWYENFPLSICEAMATGCPIVASDVGNVRDLLVKGAAGLLFTAGDADALVRAVNAATDRPGALAGAARMARDLYESHYTADVNYGQLVAIYERALSTKAVTA